MPPCGAPSCHLLRQAAPACGVAWGYRPALCREPKAHRPGSRRPARALLGSLSRHTRATANYAWKGASRCLGSHRKSLSTFSSVHLQLPTHPFIQGSQTPRAGPACPLPLWIAGGAPTHPPGPIPVPAAQQTRSSLPPAPALRPAGPGTLGTWCPVEAAPMQRSAFPSDFISLFFYKTPP